MMQPSFNGRLCGHPTPKPTITDEEPKAMADLEHVEINRYRRELEHDVRHLVKKYCRIMSWEVPELDEAEASKLIFLALRQALDDAEKE
jgi:hypothetical protein